MSERIKLSDPGDEVILTIASVSIEEIEANKYAKFTGSGKELLVPMSSVERQYERLGVSSAQEAVGLTVKFSRSTKLSKYGKPFWNCDVVSRAEENAAPSKRIAGPSSVPGEAPKGYSAAEVATTHTKAAAGQVERQGGVTLDDVASAYEWAFGMASKVQGGAIAEDSPPPSWDAIQAGSATLLIALQKEGLMRGFAARSFDTAVRKTFDLPDPNTSDSLPFSAAPRRQDVTAGRGEMSADEMYWATRGEGDH